MNVYRLPLVRFPTSFAALLTLKLRPAARALLPIVGETGLPPEPPVKIPPGPEELDPEPPDDFTIALGPGLLGPEPGGIGPREFSGVTWLEDCESGPVPAALMAATLKVYVVPLVSPVMVSVVAAFVNV
jgi:hypothetical protein